MKLDRDEIFAPSKRPKISPNQSLILDKQSV